MTTAAIDARRCALALLASLDERQRGLVRGDLADAGLRRWTYLPGDRPGLSMEHLTDAQHTLAVELLRSAHSPEGGDLAFGAVEVERVRRELATGSPPAGDRYWLRVLGDPDGDQPWGWRINGHHLAVHVVVGPAGTTVTPHFIGSEPATVPSGRRILGAEEDLARRLAAGFDPDQRVLGISSGLAPDDILTRADPVADPAVLPTGIGWGQLHPEQQDILGRLVRRYLGRAPAAYALACWRDAEAAGLERIRFAWAGPTTPGEGHYYCVRAPEFLIEYDNTQDGANHAHSVWRHLRDDWGGDLLHDHYARRHPAP
ncbi:DUF3500 domain-containing protein [Paractinoplanes globisporus]|uniref:DUF3500 domain-containing protein n=1 Tax=Paractinoplanes globisporus TaxID=113565 RepID=A0ABW6W751_9ACTN|nr:DUF3500 domain-containing protein [Actinoplanes globisporus]